MQWVKDNVASVLAVAGAVMIAYASLSMAQKDIEDLEASDKLQNEVLKEIPAMASDIENIEGDISDINGAVQRIETLLTDNALDNAKYHHEH
jgi:peptidoglycan hydrolase CwlO-like protein